jgi:hypothetical protein
MELAVAVCAENNAFGDLPHDTFSRGSCDQRGDSAIFLVAIGMVKIETTGVIFWTALTYKR